MHNIYEHTQEELPPSIDEEEFQECEQFDTDQDLQPPTDDIFEFITSQDHSDDQLDQVLQTYQAYQQSQSETETPPRQLNAHITYHVAQAQQAKHGSLVDRGANGGLAGSDVRTLTTSHRKCTVTGIDNHEVPGWDLVECAALVQTNHGIVNLIMNEYATIFSDTPAVDRGVKQAQVFVGRDSLVADVYPMKSGKQFINTLEDNIRRRGAMDKLLSDSAKTEIYKKIMDILRAYHISNWHSEPYHQNQNPAEWQYRTIKSSTNTVMNRSGAPTNGWLLCMIYICYILNHIACGALNGSIPLLVLYGITPDISIMLLYTFYQPVFYATHDQHFPSESEERAAFWVGFGEHCGDAMTHKLLDKITQKIIYRSAVRPITK